LYSFVETTAARNGPPIREETIMSTHGDGFSTRTVELGSGRIHLHEAGSGEPLVFVHGFGVNSRLWTETATALAGEYRCILPELPFGSHPEAMHADADLSPTGAAALIAELLAELGLEDVTIVANDSGGAISQILVTEHPQRIARLALTNCDCLEVFPPGVFKVLATLSKLPGASTLLAQSLRFEFNRRSPIAYGALTKKRLSSDLLESWARPQIADKGVRRDARKFFGGMDPKFTLAAAEKFGELRIPVLIAWAEEDRFFKVALAERLERMIPDAELVRIPDALTFVSLDQPQLLADTIAGFLARRPLGSGTPAASKPTG
jgi:pimeloyl-ACP methyl ester carboxylesterase